MIKNILSVLIFLFSLSFFFLIGNVYFSDVQKKKINKKRVTMLQIINSSDLLPILSNDTNDVIEFNSGFENDTNKIERNFWKLFKKND